MIKSLISEPTNSCIFFDDKIISASLETVFLSDLSMTYPSFRSPKRDEYFFRGLMEVYIPNYDFYLDDSILGIPFIPLDNNHPFGCIIGVNIKYSPEREQYDRVFMAMPLKNLNDEGVTID